MGSNHYQYQLFPVIYEDWSVIVLYINNENENLSVGVRLNFLCKTFYIFSFQEICQNASVSISFRFLFDQQNIA